MNKQLFFDDNQLFSIDNAERKYGKIEVVGEYSDNISSTDFCTGQVFHMSDGTYRLLYFAHSKLFSEKKLMIAESNDGISFKPCNINGDSSKDNKLPHEIMTLPHGGEVAYVYEDKLTENESERYKLLMAVCEGGTTFIVRDELYVSPDLIHWTIKENVRWANSAEPLAGVFYNKNIGKHTILQRPYWGIRRVGYKETADWENYSEYRDCFNVDALDEPLAEIYGMFAFEYDGYYIGIPHFYRNLGSSLNAKYKGGIIDTQLAYSLDGRYWRRSLRQPFISGLDRGVYMSWVSDMKKDNNGDVIFYGSSSRYEHGSGFEMNSTEAGKPGKITIYKMRSDGFVALASKDKEQTSVVATREKIWQGGEAHINIKAKRATVAVYSSSTSSFVYANVLGHVTALEGMGHEDCIPFSGDSTDWIPTYRTGKTVSELKGETLVFEIRFDGGELYSFYGNYVDAFNTEAARYRKLGTMPN